MKTVKKGGEVKEEVKEEVKKEEVVNKSKDD